MNGNMSTVDELLTEIFDGRSSVLYAEFEDWARNSRRFREFAIRYRGKIRAKLNNARHEGAMDDLRAELEVAALLLSETRFTLEYEKYAASKQRGPDFTVTFRTHTPFNVEVRRVRSVEMDDEGREPGDRLISVLLDKVRQMPPGIVNFLWLVSSHELPEGEIDEAAARLRRLAERKDEDYFTRKGFDSAADFLKQYQRLSAIAAGRTVEKMVWLNPLARHKAAPDIVTAIRQLTSR